MHSRQLGNLYNGWSDAPFETEIPSDGLLLGTHATGRGEAAAIAIRAMIVDTCGTENAMTVRPWTVRPFDASHDTEAVQRIDTSYVTSESYQVRWDGARLVLEPVAESVALTRTYTIDLGVDDWQHGCVAVLDGEVRGFIAWAEEAWNRRLSIWHFYVDRRVRRSGAGHMMMNLALEWAAHRRLLTAWVETSNANLPGIASYRRLGFEICGFDTTLYRGTPGPNEFAIYMARGVAMPSKTTH